MMSVKEQEITAATARLKDESDHRTIVLKIKTPPVEYHSGSISFQMLLCKW